VIADLEGFSGTAPIVDARLADYSRWRVGGRAAALIEPVSRRHVEACLAYLASRDLPNLVIGDGSNILFDDAGFDGVIVRVGPSMSKLMLDGGRVWAEAGIWVPRFVRLLGQRGLAGLEHAIGIPGTLGGLVIMNGGSRRLGVGRNIVRVGGCDLRGKPFERTGEECDFRYRGSTLQDDQLIVLDATFSFEQVERSPLRQDMISIMTERRNKFPKKLPNCGSVFLSDPAMYKIVGPPGAAIERAGLKGTARGGAQISPMHANFIVNNGNASSRDILGLIHLIRTTVHHQTGFWMDCEVRHVAPDGRVRPAHLPAAEAEEENALACQA